MLAKGKVRWYYTFRASKEDGETTSKEIKKLK